MGSRRTANPTATAWAEEIELWQRRLSPLVPEIPPEDLALVLASILQPRAVPRRWLSRKVDGAEGHAI